MIESNRNEFIEMLSATLDLYGRKLSPGAYSIWFESLSAWPIDACRKALAAYVQSGGDKAPVPFDIIKIIQGNDGHPGPEEAWAMLRSAVADESVTVVWTEPMREAFFVAVSLSDDLIAARMAFKERYTAALADARETGHGPTWTVSFGHDKQGREPVLAEAVRLGRLSGPQVRELLPDVSGESEWLTSLTKRLTSGPGEELAA